MKFQSHGLLPKSDIPISQSLSVNLPINNYANIKIRMGDPRRKCLGAGVCKIMALDEKFFQSCTGIVINGYLNIFSNNYLNIIVKKADLTFSQRKEHFSKGVMKYHMDIALSSTLLTNLELKESIIICSGLCKIYQIRNCYHQFVRFKRG